MSDNVLEQLVGQLRAALDNHQRPMSQVVAEADRYAVDLEASLNPCRYMPPLSEWPEGAEWCAVDADGSTCFFEKEPETSGTPNGWDSTGGTFLGVDNPLADIPLGIDWRTLKVSRKQMEEYEDE